MSGWTVPVELAIAAAPPVQRELISRRRGRGDRPRPDARVFLRDGWLWTCIDFHGPGRLGLMFRLDVPAWENGALWAAHAAIVEAGST